MKSFKDNASTSGINPFDNITDEEFKFIIEEGFTPETLSCYADLEGKICFSKSFTSSIGWYVTCYITEQGCAVDHDYDCGGNSSNATWWFEDGEYGPNTFEEAWDQMIDYAKSL